MMQGKLPDIDLDSTSIETLQFSYDSALKTIQEVKDTRINILKRYDYVTVFIIVIFCR